MIRPLLSKDADSIVTRLRNTISELQRSGHQVLVFAPGSGAWDFDGARIEALRGSRFPLYPELTLSKARGQFGSGRRTVAA